MKWLSLVCTVLIATASEARSQSNYTYSDAEQVLVDNSTGLKWQCGYGFAWSYTTYFPATYDYAKDVAPGVYTVGPYGAPGGWRLPTTAELLDASKKGLAHELDLVNFMLGLADPDDPTYDTSWFIYWGVDPKTNGRYAYYVVLATGQKVKTLRARSQLYVLLVR